MIIRIHSMASIIRRNRIIPVIRCRSIVRGLSTIHIISIIRILSNTCITSMIRPRNIRICIRNRSRTQL